MGSSDEKHPANPPTDPEAAEADAGSDVPKQSHCVELTLLAILSLVLSLFIIFGNPVLAYKRYMATAIDPATDMGRCAATADADLSNFTPLPPNDDDFEAMAGEAVAPGKDWTADDTEWEYSWDYTMYRRLPTREDKSD